jgi:CRISPR-associated endoribonuclease Cas6
MRIHLNVTGSNKIIPFNHQPLLTGAIHKWLGNNNEHGKISLYSFSQLIGGKIVSEGLKFEFGSSFFFSSYDPALIKNMIARIQNDPEMFYGLTVSELIIQNDPDLTNRDLFYVASPIFIKRKAGEKVDHILFDDPRANDCLKETLFRKMNIAGIVDETLDIFFDTSYQRAGTKLIAYNNVKNRANWCPVIIKGKQETKLFAWNVGLGNSTGIGFGAIK